MKITHYLFLLTFPICLFTISASAQIFPNVTPDNIDETVDLIFELHGNIIDNDYNTVYNFLADMLPSSSNDPSYDSLCPPPDAIMDIANSTSISYSWAPITGAYSYQAAFMKLNNFPSTGPESGSATSTNTNVQFSVSNGLILMVFQTHCSILKKGKLSIIIVDKPIFFNALTRHCDCLYPRLPIQSNSFGSGEGVASFEFTQEESIGYYQGTINFEGEDAVANGQFLIKIEFIGMDKINISKRSDCMLNLNNEPSGNILYSREGEDGEIMGSLTFSSGLGVFNPTDDRAGVFTVTECLPDPGIYDFLAPQSDHTSTFPMPQDILTAIPNPAKEFVSITLPIDFQKEEYTYTMLDALGKLIQIPSNYYHFEDRTVEIQIGDLPPGIYSFVLHSNQKIMKARFVKLN